ncbi:MAG TPA: Dabb family protein [Desulfobaccales bacterium]
MITHIALFKMVHANKEIIEVAQKALEGLAGMIPQLRHFEVGINIIQSYRSYDLALVAKFDSLEDLQTYQNHPDYVEVVKYLQGVRQSVVTVDYETP